MMEQHAVVQFSASKVAAVVGLHEYADPVEDFMEYLYQNHEEMLQQDARASGLQVMTKTEELQQLVRKSVSRELIEIMLWSAKDHKTPAKTSDANQLVQSVDKLVGKAQQKRRLASEEAAELKSLLKTRIHQSVGVRNESTAIKHYERLQGCQVRLRNENFYYLTFPSVEKSSVKWEEALMTRHVVSGDDGEDDDTQQQERGGNTLFTICGKIDGVTDALEIAPSLETGQEDWRLVPIVVEVKNRLRAFREPLPLHDHIQLAVYMKMLDVTAGDLVECINDKSSKPQLRVTRVELTTYPLNAAGLTGDQRDGDLWTTVIVPRLYAYTEMLCKFRVDASLRVAFLLSSPKQQLEALRAECDFL